MWEIQERDGLREVFIDTPVPMTYKLCDPRTDWPNLDAVLMDMDGSSTDTERLVLDAMRQMVAEALGWPDFQFKDEDYPHIIGDSTKNHLTWLLPEYDLDLADLPHYEDRYYKKYHKSLCDIRDGKVGSTLVKPMHHLREFLTWAKGRGLKVGLVTSSLEFEADIIMPEVFRGMDIGPDYRTYYDGVIAADSVGQSFLKPHPNLYILMRERLDVPPERCLVIEDSAAGIIAGRLAGCAVAAVPHSHTKNHCFETADVGIFHGGLAEVQADIKRRIDG